jgi:hypothetical protein
MKPDSSINQLPWNFDVSVVMKGALKLEMTFTIDLPNGTRSISSEIYLSHDSTCLYIAGRFVGVYSNPFSVPNGTTLPDFFQIMFDVPNDGVLKPPESGSRLSMFIYPDGAKIWGYHDVTWQYAPGYDRSVFWLADNLVPPPSVLAWGSTFAKEYDNTTGTLTEVFSRFLNCSGNSDVNALQMQLGERWVMGFVLELGYATWSPGFGDYVDGWPRNIYPFLSNDSSWWPKMVIDLTNPPTTYLGSNETTTPNGLQQ